MQLILPDGTRYTYPMCANAVFRHLVRDYVDPDTGDMSDSYLNETWGKRRVYSMIADEHEKYGPVVPTGWVDNAVTSAGGYLQAYNFAKILAEDLM